mmetsp:Transcript_30978/g.83156  ORF Transcript_30978/g.83156 Transcript_30978/m.83156 type:complete len:285 (+) Transcript_30978:1533-2387(+)
MHGPESDLQQSRHFPHRLHPESPPPQPHLRPASSGLSFSRQLTQRLPYPVQKKQLVQIMHCSLTNVCSPGARVGGGPTAFSIASRWYHQVLPVGPRTWNGFELSSSITRIPTSPGDRGPAAASPYCSYSAVSRTSSPTLRPSFRSVNLPRPSIITSVPLKVLRASLAGPENAAFIDTSSPPKLKDASRVDGSNFTVIGFPCISRFVIFPPLKPDESIPTSPCSIRYALSLDASAGMTPTLQALFPCTMNFQVNGSEESAGSETRRTGPLGDVNLTLSSPTDVML